MGDLARTIKAKNSWVLLASLWLAVLVTALSVVRTTHLTRGYLNQLEVMRREATQLHVAWGQYLLEQSTWSAYSRIEREAVEQLRMEVPKAEQLVMVQ